MQQLLIATTSAGKAAEWRELLGSSGFELLELADVGLAGMDVEETGETYADNALLKAEAYGHAIGLLTLAEDSGLSVDALDGGPGVRSARWAGDNYAVKNRLLIDLVADRPSGERGCAYVCVALVRHPDGRTWRARGELRGEIAREAAGGGGFGYDPIFYIPRLRQTLAQISIHEKDRISHRGRAARRVRAVLRRLVEAGQA